MAHNGSQINTVKDMKKQILKVAQDLEQGTITDIEAQKLLLCLFGVRGSFISVSEQEPPHDTERFRALCPCRDKSTKVQITTKILIL